MPYFKRGSELTVNSTTVGDQWLPDIFTTANNGFGVSWSESGSLLPSGNRARLFTETGSTSGPDLLDSATFVPRPKEMLSNGHFIGVASTSGAVGPVGSSSSKVIAQFFDGALTATPGFVTLNNDTFNGQLQFGAPTLSVLPGGGFVVIWDAFAQNAATSIFGQVFDTTGQATSARFLVGSTTTNTNNRAATLSDGHFAVVWSDGGNLYASVYNPDGTATGNIASVDTSSAIGSPTGYKIASLKNGGFAVLWDENLSSNANVGVGSLHLQIFDSASKSLGGDIVVSTAGPAQVGSTDIAVLRNGDIGVVWTNRGPDGTSTDPDISLHLYSATGATIGTEQIVNASLTGAQSYPSIAALDNGGFVVGWSDLSHTGPDTSGYAVHAQIFTPNAPKTLTGTAAANTLTGGLGDDTLEGRAGDDRLDGGAGYDTASYARAAAGVQVSLAIKTAQDTVGDGRDTLVSIENLTGSAFADKLTGNGGDNTIDGRNGNDIVNGGAGNDHLIGGSGNDVLNGGTGDDLMEGGLGNDTYYVNSIYDRIYEAAAFDAVKNKDVGGIDTVHASIDYSLSVSASPSAYGPAIGSQSEIPNHIEKLTLDGTANLSATGNALDNRIIGNAGNNLIDGGFGADRLTGGAGADSFVFSQLEPGKVDIITDFAPGTDHLTLAQGNFAALLNHALGALTDAELALGAKATTADQHLIYNAATGALFYDADGSGAQAQVKIAVLLGHPDLHAGDIIII